MLFSTENLPYWIFLGSGIVLFVAIFSGQTGRRTLSRPLPLRMALTLTVWGLLGWLTNVIAGIGLGQLPQGLIGFGVVAITLILALIVSHQMMSPVSWIINSRRKTTSLDPLVGCVGTVCSESLYRMAEGDMAQVEVADQQGDVLVVNAALPPWANVTPQQGDRVTLIGRSDEGNVYYAVASDSPDQEHWLKQAASI